MHCPSYSLVKKNTKSNHVVNQGALKLIKRVYKTKTYQPSKLPSISLLIWNDHNSISLEGQHIPTNAAEVQAVKQLLLRVVCLIEGFKPWPNGRLQTLAKWKPSQ